MYTDMYLKFTDESEAKSVLFDGEKQLFANIDVIGTIYKDEQAIDGWHVNVRVIDNENADILLPFQVNPKPTTPLRIWA